MTKAEKARKLINENWSEQLHAAVFKKFGDIKFATEYSFLDGRYISSWSKSKKLPHEKIKQFVEGFESGCLACMQLMTTL